MSVSVKVTGLDELRKMLRKVDRKRNKILLKAMRAGARPIAKAARANAPRRKSQPPRKEGKPLHKSIVVRAARKRRGSDDDVSVKVTSLNREAHLVEFGHMIKRGKRQRAAKDTRQALAHVPANPFMRRAFDANKGEAQAIMARSIASQLEHEVKG